MKFRLLTLVALLLSPLCYGQDRPNIVLINADDLGWAELGCYGQDKIKTPRLDRLAAQGQRWTHFYSGAPVCSPSRNVLMTGRHTGCNDVQDLKRVDKREGREMDLRGDWPISAQAYTLPESLKKLGYATAIFGKWGLGEYGTTGAPDKHGFDTAYGYTDQRMCHTYYPPFLWDNGKKITINDPFIPGHKHQPKGEVKAENYRAQNHSSELIIDRAVDYINTRGKQGDKQPFFLYYAPLEPHVAMQPLQQWIDQYPAEWDAKPYRGQNGYLPHPRPRAAYAAMISQMDHNVGRLLDALQKNGLDKNTIVIFTSDNGTTHDVGGVDHKFFHSVLQLRGLKGQMYEGGLRVPGIVVWPGKIAPGKTIDQPAYHADIMPTLCAAVGANPGDTRGENLLPVWLGKTNTLPNRRPMVWAGGGYGGQVAVRLGNKKIMRRNLLPGKKEPGNWEVYNIASDPAEKNNIAASEGKLIEQAKQILAKEYKAAKGYPALRINALTAAPAP